MTDDDGGMNDTFNPDHAVPIHVPLDDPDTIPDDEVNEQEVLP